MLDDNSGIIFYNSPMLWVLIRMPWPGASDEYPYQKLCFLRKSIATDKRGYPHNHYENTPRFKYIENFTSKN